MAENEIKDLIKEHNGSIVKCAKLQTKYETYSSFHVEIKECDYKTVSNCDIWPDGIMIETFYMQIVVSKANKNDNGKDNNEEN